MKSIAEVRVRVVVQGWCLRRFREFLVSIALLCTAFAQAQTPEREIFAPASGRGSIIIAVSAQSSPALYRDYSAKLAEQGHYVVLVNGNDISIPGKTGAGVANLRRVMVDAQFASAMQTPALVFAGALDRYSNCCLLETMRALGQEPKTGSFQLVVYPDAGHGFNLDAPSLAAYRTQDAGGA